MKPRNIKQATVIQFGRILGKLEYTDNSELEEWLQATGYAHFISTNLGGLEIKEKKHKRYYKRKIKE